jgi:type II secretory pathway predicted ATPase ExeA
MFFVGSRRTRRTDYVNSGYLNYFGLAEGAFELNPIPRFFYANRSYQTAFLKLRYAIRLRGGLMALTGEAGVGKTTLMRVVRERCEANTQILEISSASADGAAFLARLLRALGILKIAPDESTMMAQLEEYLIEQLRQGFIVAVVIEDAQDATVGRLRQIASLARLRADGTNLLQIVLTGRPELQARLEARGALPVRQQISLRYRIRPLRAEEVGPYMAHRLACAGCRRGNVFQAAAVERVARYSKGVPGSINTICDAALRTAYESSRKSVTAEIVDQAWQQLRHSGESDFEVAALLSGIRMHSGPAPGAGTGGFKPGLATFQASLLAWLEGGKTRATLDKSWHSGASFFKNRVSRARDRVLSGFTAVVRAEKPSNRRCSGFGAAASSRSRGVPTAVGRNLSPCGRERPRRSPGGGAAR